MKLRISSFWAMNAPTIQDKSTVATWDKNVAIAVESKITELWPIRKSGVHPPLDVLKKSQSFPVSPKSSSREGASRIQPTAMMVKNTTPAHRGHRVIVFWVVF